MLQACARAVLARRPHTQTLRLSVSSLRGLWSDRLQAFAANNGSEKTHRYSSACCSWATEPIGMGSSFLSRAQGPRGRPLPQRRAMRIVSAATAVEELMERNVMIDDVDMKFARSGGSGGQNVNKVNTKVDMRLKLQSARFLSEELKQGLRTRERNRINSDDELVVMSTTHRTQHANRQDALQRMQAIILAVADSLVVKEMTAEQAKKQQKMIARASNRRLEAKKSQSKKKAERNRTDW